jgi:hypothetical protein
MTLTTRLGKITTALTPRQAMLLWLEEAHQFPSMVAYMRSLVGKADPAFPLYRLPLQVEQATRSAMKGEPRDLVERAMRSGIRDVCFLYQLHQRANMHVLDAEEALDLRLVRLIEGFQHLLVYEVRAVQLEELQTRCKGRPSSLVLPAWATQQGHAERKRGWCAQATALLGQAYTLRTAMDTLSQRWFAGHGVLYPASALGLTQLIKHVETLVTLFNEQQIALTADASREEATERQALMIDLAAVHAGQQAAIAVTLTGILELAKAAALDDVGERRAAHELVARQLGTPDADTR